jgi:hypothetical protein
MPGLFRICSSTREGENPRPGFDNGRQPVGQATSLRGDCPKGERSESIPPSPPYLKREPGLTPGLFRLCRTTREGENPRPGFDNGRQPVGQATSLRGDCPKGERSESIPPSPPYLKREPGLTPGLFRLCRTTREGENPRPGFDNGRQPVGQATSLRGDCPKGERSESIPPSPHI